MRKVNISFGPLSYVPWNMYPNWISSLKLKIHINIEECMERVLKHGLINSLVL